MSQFREQLKNVAGGERRRSIISSCALIAVSLVVFFVAMFAPFRYFSDKDVLHIVYEQSEDSEVGEEAVAEVNEIKSVRQSLFMLFEATTMLGDASTLHAASNGEIYDEEDYSRARERLAALRDEYSKIVNDTKAHAQKLGISEASGEYKDMLADNLSRMNLMALDMLETAFASDNTGSYEAVFGGVVLGLLNGIVNLLIAVAALVAIVFAVLRLFKTTGKPAFLLFFTVFSVLSAVGLLMCVFNPVVPPAACPLALCIIATVAYFAAGLARSVVGDVPLFVIVKNAVVAAVVPIATICLSIMPSLTIYVKGMGGHYLYYPGTVGTVMYSRVEAMLKIGLGIPDGAVKAAFMFGIAASALAVIASTVALERQYCGAEGRGAVYTVLLFLAAFASVALAASVSAISADLNSQGTPVEYIVGASWYIMLALFAAVAIFITVFDEVKRHKTARESAAAGEERVTCECANSSETAGAEDYSVRDDATAVEEKALGDDA